jgi:hypothetical protein
MRELSAMTKIVHAFSQTDTVLFAWPGASWGLQ